MRNYAKVLHKIFKQHMFWIFVRIASTKYPKHMFSSESDSTKYSKHMFYEEIRIKQGLGPSCSKLRMSLVNDSL